MMELSRRTAAATSSASSTSTRRVLIGDLPLAEIIVDFNDKLKSDGAATPRWTTSTIGYRPAELVQLDMLITGEPVDAFASIVHRDKAPFARPRPRRASSRRSSRASSSRSPIQATIGGKIIARETIRPMRKNVTAKCYGGDITRKRKLLEKQKEGKQRMKRVGSVEIPQEAFLAVLRMGEE